MLLMIIQGVCEKVLRRCSARHKDTPLKASYFHSVRHTTDTHRAKWGRDVSYTPLPGKTFPLPGKKMGKAALMETPAPAPWDTILHRQFPLPLKTCTGLYTQTCQQANCPCSPVTPGTTLRGFLPLAGTRLQLLKEGTPQPSLLPCPCCFQSCARSALPSPKPLCRATGKLLDTDPEYWKEQWQLGPKMSI